MATRRWLGVDGDWNNVLNWSGGAVPVDNDDVVIDAGSIDITGNLNQAGVNLNSLTVTTGFKGNIGTNGTSLTIDANGASPTGVKISMSGAYIYWNGTSTANITIGSTGPGAFYMTGGSFSGVSFIGGSTGKCYILSGVTMGTVYTAGASLDVTPAFTTGIFNGGNSVVRADVTTLTLGTNAGCTLEGSGVDVTTAHVNGGARLILNNGGATAGVITTLNAYPGSYVANGGKFNNTITTLNQWAGSTQVLNAAAARTTVTNPIVPVGQQ